MTEYDYMATEPETFTVQAGKRYLNGYGRIIGPLVYHDGWQRYISGHDVYHPSGRIDNITESRLHDLVKEYVEPVIATQAQTPDSEELDDTNFYQAVKQIHRQQLGDLISLTATHLLMFGLGFGTAVYFLIGVAP